MRGRWSRVERLERRDLLAVSAAFPAFPLAGIDPIAALGPSTLLAVVDERARLMARDGTLLDESGLTAPLNGDAGMFEAVDRDGGNWSTAFDPWALYDRYDDVFFVSSIQVELGGGANEANVLLAVSTSQAPDDFDSAPGDTDNDWHVFSLPAVATVGGSLCKIDNPRLAVDADSLYIVGLYFTFSDFTFRGATIIRLDKAPLRSGVLGARHDTIATGAGRLRPAETVDRGPGEPLILVDEDPADAGLRIWEFDDANVLQQVAQIPAPFVRAPEGAPQPGTAALLRTHTPYPLNAVWRDGRLWTAQTVARATGEATVRWTEIDTASGYALVQQGEIVPGAGIHSYLPALAVNDLGDLAITYTTSSTSQPASMHVTGRRAADAPGELSFQALVKSGEGAYAPAAQGPIKKWGDYAGLNDDPADPDRFWALHLYTTASVDHVGTWWANFRINEPAIAAAGGPYALVEGESLVLDASASLDPDGLALVGYEWDLNGDGVYGDVVAVQPTVTWPQLQALGLGDGPAAAAVRVRVIDAGHDASISAAVALTIANVPPSIALAGASDVAAGALYTLELGAISDPGQDTVTHWRVDWGDGSSPEVYASGGAVTHVFADGPAVCAIVVDLLDEDGWHEDAGTLLVTVANRAPRLASSPVILWGSHSVHPAYDVPVGSGEQLRTVPVAGIDRIALRFSEDVLVWQEHLTLAGHVSGSRALSSFDYDPQTRIATWSLDAPLEADRWTLLLADAVADLHGAALDGEWLNPLDLADPIGSLESGDGLAGGAFEFRFTVLPGDATRDNVVSGADYTIWNDRYDDGLGPPDRLFAEGDFTGDGHVTGADYTIWLDHYGIEQGNAGAQPEGAASRPSVAPAAGPAFGAALSTDRGKPAGEHCNVLTPSPSSRRPPPEEPPTRTMPAPFLRPPRAAVEDARRAAEPQYSSARLGTSASGRRAARAALDASADWD